MQKNNPVAVITGAASGLGLEMAKVCLEKEMNVIMADKDVSSLCDQVEELSRCYSSDVLAVVCDVAKQDSVRNLAKQTFDRFDRVDWLINNAGISGHLAPFWELTSEHIRKVSDINLFGVINGIHTFLPYLFKQNFRSRIINISSVYGLCSGSNLSAYAMTKHAVVALSESLYFDLKRLDKPVDVSVVCPSFANTNLLTHSRPIHEDKFHNMLENLMEKSRPANEVANKIIEGIMANNFYILPDREVKDYSWQKAQAIQDESAPHKHSLEMIISSLSHRAMEYS